MKILISNDDGVNAPGINTLYQHLKKDFSCTVVAPSDEKSTTGHSLNLDHPVRLHQLADDKNIYHCSGYPADTILMGLGHVLKDNRPDVIVSGINRGGNLGQDLYYSGTMAAAREGAFHFVPSIAVSLVILRSGEHYHFSSAAEFINKLLKSDIHLEIPKFAMLNINVPNLPLEKIKGVKIARMGFRKYSEQIEKRFDSRERSYYWIGGHLEGHHTFNGTSDCEIVQEGYIAVTPLYLLLGDPVDFTAIHKKVKLFENFPLK